jgi:RNA polymerase sigma factor (sigma-70 family)
MDNAPNEFIPTRRSLLSRLRNWDDQESWKDFFDTYWKLIYNTAVKAGLTDAEAQDVVQETVFTVAKKMPKFEYDPAVGSFKGWLLKTTRWRILDHIKRVRTKEAPLPRHRPGHESDGTNTTDLVPDAVRTDLEKIWNAEWQKNLIGAATERVKRRVRPKHYQMFELHVLKELPVPKVAELLGVSKAQVHLAKHRISRLVKKEIQRLESNLF